jgi:hypothetical protein
MGKERIKNSLEKRLNSIFFPEVETCNLRSYLTPYVAKERQLKQNRDERIWQGKDR